MQEQKSFQGKRESMLQVGGKMEGDGEENDGDISELEPGYWGLCEVLQTWL